MASVTPRFRDARPYTGTLYLMNFFFLKQIWYLWVWPTSYNRIKILYIIQKNYHWSGVHQKTIHLSSPIYKYKTVLLHLQITARNLHVVNPSWCVGPTVCGSLQMSSPVPTRIKTMLLHLSSPIYKYKTVLLHLQIRAQNLHVVNPSWCVGPTVCGSLQMSSPVPTRIKTRAKLYA